jgi:hypothetical protein
MESETRSDFEWVDSSVTRSSLTMTSVTKDIDLDFSTTFCQHPNLSDLQIERFFDHSAQYGVCDTVSSGEDINEYAVSPSPFLEIHLFLS